MGAAFGRVDVVGKAVRRFGVAVVPLQRDVDGNAVALAVHHDWPVVHRCPVLVEELDELADAPFVQETVVLAVALVVDHDRHAGIQERQLTQALRQGLEAEFGDLEDRGVRLERDFRAALLRRAGHLEGRAWGAALIALLVDLAVAPDLELEPLRQGVDDRNADAVQSP